MPSKTDFQKYLDTKKTDTRLTGHIERHLMKKEPGDRSTTVLHPSEMIKADFCHRYSYYLLTGGKKMEKNQEDMDSIVEYLKTGPQNLASFDYKDWDNETTEKVMSIIRNTVPDGRLVNEIIAGAGLSTNASSAAPATKSNEFFAEASSTNVGSTSTKAQPNTSSTPTPASSLDDLYADL
jgi:hypothetical protein